MKHVMKRLKSKAGETLVESMAAILIFTFASIIMLSMVSSAADINTAAKEADQKFFTQMVTIEQAYGTGTAVSVSFSLNNTASSLTGSDSVTAAMYGTPDDGLYAYYVPAPSEPVEEGGDES